MGPHPAERSILVTSFYKGQLHALRKAFKRKGHTESIIPDRGLRIASVDQSQGSEADVVLISCVRSNIEYNIGFLTKPNRLNVAISRGRSRVVLVGDKRTLKGPTNRNRRTPLWLNVLKACKPLAHANALAPLVGV